MGNNSQLSFSKLQMFLLLLVSAFVGLLSWVFWGFPASNGLNTVANSPQETLSVNYVMAKIQSAMSLFSLEGREINRKYLTLDDQGLNAKPAHIIPGSRSANAKSAGTAKPDSKIKDSKKDPKKSSAAVVQSAPKPAAKPVVNKAEERKKRLAEWDEYNKKMKDWQEKKARSEAQKKALDQQTPKQSNYNQSYSPPTTSTTDETKKPKKSIDEWKQELLTAGSPEAARNVMVKFVAAFKNKEVEEIEFYMIVQGFLKSPDENQKGLGLYALRGTPSYASYLLLVKQQSEFSPAYQKYIQETLMSYHQGQLGTLQQALSGKDNQVIAKTLEVLKTGITNIKNGNNDGMVDSRYRRDTDFITFNVKSYLGFSKILEQLGQTGDGSIKTAALEVAALINSAQPATQPVVAGTP